MSDIDRFFQSCIHAHYFSPVLMREAEAVTPTTGVKVIVVALVKDASTAL
ncbi:hypothetical protein [Sodalis glossinidius]|nr:hypothetical protein [Sodalis glossinidius]